MPSEPEKKIEPLLSAYATRRRQAADPAAAMPAGMRRRLQSEVRRRWGQPSAPGIDHPRRWYQALAALWPRLATAGGIAAVLAASLWWLSPPKPDQNFASAPAAPSPKSPAEPATLADNDHRLQAPAAATKPQTTAAKDKDNALRDHRGLNVTNRLYFDGAAAPTASFDTVALVTTTPVPVPAAPRSPVPISAQPSPSSAVAPLLPFQEAAPRPVLLSQRPAGESEARFESLESRQMTVRSRAADASTPLPIVANQTVTTQKSAEFQRFNLATQPSQLSLSSASPTAPPPAPLPSTTSGRGFQSYFRNVQPSVPPTTRPERTGAGFAQRRLDATRAASNQVLSTFALEQSGSTVRLIDADGSIYEGQIGPAVETPLESAMKRNATERESARSTPLAKTDRSAAQSELAFEVSGTNTTLRQPVYVAGTLLYDSTNALFPTGVEGFGAAPNPAPATEPGVSTLGKVTKAGVPGAGPASQVLRIQGRGRFGVSNELRIDAVPSVPR